MKFHFPIIVVDQDFNVDNISGSGMRALAEAIEAQGEEVVAVTQARDFLGLAQQSARASAFIISIDEPENGEEELEDTKAQNITDIREMVKSIRARNIDVPIYLYGRTHTSRDLPSDITREMHGFMNMFEDTNEFMARRVIREAKKYVEELFTPFFGALVNYAQNSSYSWHTPGHSGGVAYLKSPVGQLFHQFYGENMLRSDVCNSVEELGQPLTHTGPIAESEKNAARIFKADHCFFVTNGTSTSNKVVWHANVAPGDIVVVDRNCHKSNLHAIIMTGAIPVFLSPTRNYHGIIGPIPKSEFEMDTIQAKIDAHPLITDKTRKPKILTLTQCTYDGVMYNAHRIKQMLDGKIDTLHFDEAWQPHAYFHPFYKDYYAIDGEYGRTQNSTVFSTQSTHKLLASISQASQILVQDAVNRPLDRYRFNEAYLMHTSTSPQYSIIASCDIAAAMMDEPGGTALTEESLIEAMDFRHAMRKISAEYAAQNTWWYEVWGPDYLPQSGIGEPRQWQIRAGDHWHGFGSIEPDMNMLDPIKTTVMMPGLNMDGSFDESGIPAAMITLYLADYGIIIDKLGLYSFFVIFNIGITKGRWNSLLTELQQFKDIYDSNKPMWRVFPDFVKKYPQYEQMGVADLCQAIHQMYRTHNVAHTVHDMYLSNIRPAMTPADAWGRIAHAKVTRVNIRDLTTAHITGVLLTPYPPGIPLLIPGEYLTQEVIDYLHFALEFNQKFAGFELTAHGLIQEWENGQLQFYIDCVDAA